MDDKTGQVQLTGLHVDLVHAVVAHLRIGQGNQLAGVRGVRDDLLVTDHRGVEDHLAERLALRACATPKEVTAVLKRQKRLGMLAAVNQKVQRNTVLSPASCPHRAALKKRSLPVGKLRIRLRKHVMDAFSVSRTALKVFGKYSEGTNLLCVKQFRAIRRAHYAARKTKEALLTRGMRVAVPLN